jgi:excisionase family DNA binding protein
MNVQQHGVMRFYTVAELAKIFGVVPKTIHRWIAAGDLVAHRLNRRIRVSDGDLQTFILIRRQG